MNYDWSPYAIGGATRPDSFTSMAPGMREGLWGFLQSADEQFGPGALQVYSGYRSPELQARLWENAAAKYPDPAVRRKWVAPPGRSMHNKGMAADLKFRGTRIDKADPSVAAWIRDNAPRHGLAVPMSWKPWQIELQGARGGGRPKVQGSPASDTVATPRPQEQRQMNPLFQPHQREDEPRSFMDRLKGAARDGSLVDGITAAANTLRMRPDPSVEASIQQRQQQRQVNERRNRTADWLRQNGRDDLAGAVDQGLISGRDAFAQMQPQGPDLQVADGGLVIDRATGQVVADHRQPNANIETYEYFRREGLSHEDALAAGRNGQTINFNGNSGPQVGSIPPGHVLQQREDGSYEMQVIPGSPASREIQQQEAEGVARDAMRQLQRDRTTRQGNIVMEDIGRIQDIVQNSSLPVTGPIGGFLSQIPGTNAFDAGALVGTLRANIGFDALQQMREASPTGAALGQVTEWELKTLQAIMGNLEQAQSREQFLFNLERLGAEYSRIVHGAQGGSSMQAPSGPGIDLSDDPFGIFGDQPRR